MNKNIDNLKITERIINESIGGLFRSFKAVKDSLIFKNTFLTEELRDTGKPPLEVMPRSRL